MDDRIACFALNHLWLAANVPSWAAYTKALHDPRGVQLRILRDTLTRNADTAFGAEHDFGTIASLDEYRRRVPVRRYDEVEPWIDRIVTGESRVLTEERVTRLVPTSGSSGARKLIPFCASLQSQFNRALAPWLVDLYASNADLANGRAYWSITPAAGAHDEPAKRDSPVPVGFDHDAEYIGGWMQRLVANTLVIPPEVRRARDMDAFRYITVLLLLRARDLRLISIWHPSFWPLLFQSIAADWEPLLRDIADGPGASSRSRLDDSLPGLRAALRPLPERSKELERLGPARLRDFWPHLQLISCWTDGFAEHAASTLARAMPGVRIQPKGLLATEAFISIPIGDTRPLAIRSHFLEFLDGDGRECLADELAIDREYEPVVTTAGGLYRYRLGDRVRVSGMVGRTPSIEFVGRADRVSDRFGEKLSDAFVERAIRRCLRGAATPAFAMLAPDSSPPRFSYTLYLESPIATPVDMPRRLDALLRENPHYDYCRRLGQIELPRVYLIAQDAQGVYARHARTRQRWGDIKPAALSPEHGWSTRFTGRYIEPRDSAPAS